tara:strand:+ start:4543 stop:5469 length:927 start_codon:yes stop_codon:yes gene_type:complete
MDRKQFITTSILATGGLCSLGFENPKPNTKKSELHLLPSVQNGNLKNICKTCGTRYAKHLFHKDKCSICLDERQYVKSYGQQWVSYNELAENHSVKIKKLNIDLYELKVLPEFAIAQRAFYIKSKHGNILWDCIPFIDQPTVDFIKNNGGLSAIVISHPHYYSLMNEWAKAFDCPIYLQQKDEEWIMDNKTSIKFWNDETKKLNQDFTIHRIGGHFAGSSVLETNLSSFNKSLFVGDTLYLSRDKKHLSVMFSYPNVIPLSHQETKKVFDKIKEIEFDSLFGAFSYQTLESDAHKVFEKSFNFYKNLI